MLGQGARALPWPRILISLILCSDQILHDPILFLSLYFKNHRQAYYNLLEAVRIEGDWEAWLEFFARAVKETADQCTATAEKTNRLARVDRARILELGRIAGSATLVHQELLAHPLTTIARMSKVTGLVPNTVRKVFSAMAKAGIVREITGKRRNRLFAYGELLDTMNEGTKPL